MWSLLVPVIRFKDYLEFRYDVAFKLHVVKFKFLSLVEVAFHVFVIDLVARFKPTKRLLIYRNLRVLLT